MKGFWETICRDWPPAKWVDVHVIVAVSGGPDSMALLHALDHLKRGLGGSGALTAVHVNHALRPSANADEAWVVDQFQRLGVDYSILQVKTREAAERQGDGIEAAARSLRYAALQDAAQERGARYVALGHTADDQVETVLHRILRGTGIDGLMGMPSHRPLGPSVALVRPLLSATRSEVLKYLGEVGQPYREDPTNQDMRYTRNRIRHELLPLLRQQYNIRIDEALVRLAQGAREQQTILRPLVDELVERCATLTATRIMFEKESLRGHAEPLVRAVIRAAWRSAGWPEQKMTDAAWRELTAALYGEGTGRFCTPGGIDVRSDAGNLILERPAAAQHRSSSRV